MSSSPGEDAGRVLAVDYGRRRLGIALSDPLRIIASPFATLHIENPEHGLARLKELIRDREIAEVVIGLPKHLSGAEGEMAVEVREWAARLHEGCGIPVHLIDERLTTQEAERTRKQTGRRGHSDDLAAALVLRVFLERCR